ncbi:MAG: S4 domain-containing protein [Pseudomonadota bacterium]
MKDGDTIRIDKWLWQARFFKTRTKATAAVTAGAVRINAQRCQKASQSIRPGDVLTFVAGRDVRVIRVEAIGTRRGPASEAATLFTDLDPPKAQSGATEADPAAPTCVTRDPGSGRPTKRQRRKIDALRRSRS